MIPPPSRFLSLFRMILNNEILTHFCWLLKIYFVPVRTFFNIKPMNFVFSYLSKVNR